MNRLSEFFDERTPSARLLEAAHQSEQEYAAAVRAAASGEDFDPQELLQAGAAIGRPPFVVYADVRLASIAWQAWQNSVPHYFG